MTRELYCKANVTMNIHNVTFKLNASHPGLTSHNNLCHRKQEIYTYNKIKYTLRTMD